MEKELEKKIQQSIRLLQSIPNSEAEPIEVAYSGGKDSDVILQLAKEAGIHYRAIYKSTTIDPPGTIAHVKAMGVEVLPPKKSFRELIAKKGLPSRLHRFCCEHLKEYKVLDKAIIGVRKCESTARTNRYSEPTLCRFYGKKKEHVEQIYPLLEWTDEDVKQFIEDRGIKCAPVYYDADGCFHVERRLGCLCCPLQSEKKRKEEFKAHPGMVVFYVHALREHYKTHPNCKSAQEHGSAEEQFVHDVFFPGSQKWDIHKNGIFNEPIDYKQFLENYFNIRL